MHRWKPKRDDRPSLVLVRSADAPARGRRPSPGRRADERDEARRLAEGFKDELLGVLSHELRTPLHVVSGLRELLDDEIVGSLNADQRSYVETMGQEIDRLGRLIADVLDAGVLTSGDLPLHLEPLELAPLVEDVLALLAPRAQAKGVALVASLPDRVLPVRGDAGRLAQVLSRLLSNAIEFSPAGATVVVRARPEAGMVRVEVEDAGCGIAEGDRPLLFQRFRQLDMSLTRAHGGLGMGLFLCRRLIEAHGGRIGIAASPTGGSTFWFTLPLQG